MCSQEMAGVLRFFLLLRDEYLVVVGAGGVPTTSHRVAVRH